MKVSVFGLGYVGCVSAACLAREGHDVIGIDVDPYKVQSVQAGRSPIVEPGLDELIRTDVQNGKLRATYDGCEAVQNSTISLICVGTPSNGNGSLNVRYLENVAAEIGSALASINRYHLVVLRSTVLPGTVQQTLLPIFERCSGRQAGPDFGMCINPEFLREGSAIDDYYSPSQIVIGELDQVAGSILDDLYTAVHAPVVHTTIPVAEMLKYTYNTFHALKVAFANEVGRLCRAQGIDGQEVMDIFVQDRQLNISPAYLRPGFAFGGSCLPKDVRALKHRAKELDLDLPVLNAILDSNTNHIQFGIEMIERAGCEHVGVLGLSFKSNTDDLRESPVMPLVEALVGRGYHISIFDENVKPDALIGANRAFLERRVPHIASLMRPSLEQVLAESDIVVITNGSSSFNDVPHMLRDDQILIDLVGVAKMSGRDRGVYEGICW